MKINKLFLSKIIKEEIKLVLYDEDVVKEIIQIFISYRNWISKNPTKVTRLAIENAAAVAGTILTTETVVYEEPTKEKKEEGYGDPGLGF